MIPPFLQARYDEVRAWFVARFPTVVPPPLPPVDADPNAAVMVIDEMLARLTGRAPLRISRGAPWNAHTGRSDDAPDDS